jgi:toluene monooxygenase system ferredoxin subunit
MAFRKLATMDDLWSGEILALETDGRPVLLVNLEGSVHAYLDLCPHQRTRLSQGSLQRNVLACSTHGWEFDLRTGRGINPRTACLEAFPVRVENEDILVDVTEVVREERPKDWPKE